jgi:hypothetical protein
MHGCADTSEEDSGRVFDEIFVGGLMSLRTWAAVRAALYMAAVVASRYNPVLRAFYE